MDFIAFSKFDQEYCPQTIEACLGPAAMVVLSFAFIYGPFCHFTSTGGPLQKKKLPWAGFLMLKHMHMMQGWVLEFRY